MPPILVPFVAALSFAAAAAPPAPRPPFVDGLIEGFNALPVGRPPASIVRYRYRGQLVYFVPARCCDVPSALYDAEGRRLCTPDGGFAGGDDRCLDFFEQRREETLIWHDARDPRPSR
ncbi:hypothetical protein [Dokdonella sp.]|uniref:DUF6970 domain-containing protein n=1 Tax=Dokdonella sp. TaxID=2291710 RepID=UPI001AFE8FA2|nr:hypothetical protein [Dokdonella sp.]MBO9661468.1 hypothetical protein [Dokdonella sp.]